MLETYYSVRDRLQGACVYEALDFDLLMCCTTHVHLSLLQLRTHTLIHPQNLHTTRKTTRYSLHTLAHIHSTTNSREDSPTALPLLPPTTGPFDSWTGFRGQTVVWSRQVCLCVCMLNGCVGVCMCVCVCVSVGALSCGSVRCVCVCMLNGCVGVCVCVYVCVCITCSVYVSVFMCVCLSVCMCMCMCMCLCMYLCVCLFNCARVQACVWL